MTKPKMLREYFECNGCFMKIWEKRLAQHHTEAHPNVPHEIYVDTYFDLTKPLYKCDCCSIKLEVSQLVKHRRLAHRNTDNSFLKYKLPIIEYLHRNRIKAQSVANKLPPIVDLLSDVSETEDGEIASSESKSIDKAVECEPEQAELPDEANGCDDQNSKWETADKCVGEHCETNDKSTNTINDKQLQDGCTQTPMESPKPCIRPVLPPAMKQLGIECDEDGFLELVVF